MNMYNKTNTCQTCGEKAHNFEIEESMSCVPPLEILRFGRYELSSEYRQALYKEYPMYSAEEIVGAYLGHNPSFPSQDNWYKEQDKNRKK